MSMKEEIEIKEEKTGEIPLLEIRIIEDAENIQHETSEANRSFKKTTYWNLQKSAWDEQNTEQLFKMNEHLEKIEEQLIKMEGHLDRITLQLIKSESSR